MTDHNPPTAPGEWYADAWRSAVEDDPGMLGVGVDLKPGRNLARKLSPLSMGSLEVEPGAVTVRSDTEREPWVCTLAFRSPSDGTWDRFVGEVAKQPRLAVGVLTGSFPAGLDGAAESVGLPLVPTEASPVCSCEAWDEPCRHAVAVGFLTADVVAVDPFVLLSLLRRGRDELVTAVQAARAGTIGRSGSDPSTGPPENHDPRGPDPTMSVGDAYARTPLPIPRSAPLPRRPGEPVTLQTPPPFDSGISGPDLTALAADAASRATAMLLGEGDSALHLTADQDLVRRAATAESRPCRPDGSSGPEPEPSTGRVEAWRRGGEAGLRVFDERWDAPPAALEQASGLFGGRGRIAGNAFIAGSVQLRLDRLGGWWRFDASSSGWELSVGPFEDPADALAAPVVSEGSGLG